MRPKHSIPTAAIFLAAACGGSSPALTSSRNDATAASPTIPNSTPSFVGSAPDLGAADPTQVIAVTAWLKLQNESKLDQLIAQQQTKGHPNYHSWLSQAQFNQQFSPNSQQVNAVTNFLSAHNLTVIDVAENNFYVRVSGTVADVQKTFKVQLDNFKVNGETHRANTSNPADGTGLLAAVTGLDDLDFRPNISRATEPDGSPVATAVPFSAASAGPDGAFFARACFRPPQTIDLSDGSTTATYSGNRFGSDISSGVPNLSPCGYSPGDIRAAYNLRPLYQAGLDGTGQTIVIVDEWGSDSVAQDLALFSDFYGLGPVDFQVVKAQGLWHNTGNPHWADWTSEIALDTQWAHAIAPGAKIVLVTAPDQSLFEAVNLAVARGLGNTISNSWSNFEGFMSAASVAQFERILKHAKAKGIDVNFSTGDWGNNQPLVGRITVAYPASSTNATAIGGTSLAMDQNRNVLFETGWGNNLTMVYNARSKTPLAGMPFNEGFIFGAGGGSSIYFAKPSWQTAPGTMRQIPDISMNADPFTGVEIFQTIGGTTFVEVIGGTSLACPTFSGLMAIAAQAAGHPIGQAAPLLYGMTTGIKDVHAVTSSTNVTGSVTTSSGTTVYSADDLVAPRESSAPYYSALYQGPTSHRWFVLSFGTDTTLATGDGWDNVTGLGVPDGANFVAAITQ